MDKVVTKLKEAGLNQAAIDAFKVNYEQLQAGVTGLVRIFTAFEQQICLGAAEALLTTSCLPCSWPKRISKRLISFRV